MMPVRDFFDLAADYDSSAAVPVVDAHGWLVDA
jgi:hypothetical protein